MAFAWLAYDPLEVCLCIYRYNADHLKFQANSDG